MAPRQLGEQGEEGAGSSPCGGIAHQAGERHRRGADRVEEGRQARPAHAALLRLVADIDLDEARRAFGVAASASSSDGRSSEWMTSNRAAASAALFDWSRPIMWSRTSG